MVRTMRYEDASRSATVYHVSSNGPESRRTKGVSSCTRAETSTLLGRETTYAVLRLLCQGMDGVMHRKGGA